jgi:hypothetical protein
MAIDIEAVERALDVARKQLKQDPSLDSVTVNGLDTAKLAKSRVPRAQIETQVGGREAVIEAIPIELIDEQRARTVRFALTRAIGTQERTATFSAPVQVTSNAVLMEKSVRGKHGTERVEFERLDASKIFSGRPADQRALKLQGIRFR